MPIVAKLFSSFCVSVFLVMLKDCGLVFHQSDSVLIFGWNYLLNLFFFFPGKTCARGCLKGNGAGDQQDCGHC